jgi:hypothetical protein
VLLPYSRAHESEADHIGLFLAAKAGYDPREYAAMWRRMDDRKEATRWEFAATHPSPSTRYQQLTAWMPEAMVFYADPKRPLPTTLADAQAAGIERAAAAALAPSGVKPRLEPGFTFEIRLSDRGNRTVRVEDRPACGGAPRCIAMITDAGEENLYDEDLRAVEVRSPTSTTRYDPPLVTARFPLQVGASWSQKVSVQTDGNSRVFSFTGDVVGYESVTVPAGTFMAFKVALAANGIRFRETWWAPETRVPARVATYNATSGQTVVQELVAFPPIGDPAAIVDANAAAPSLSE